MCVSFFLKKDEKALSGKLDEIQKRCEQRTLSVESCCEYLQRFEDHIYITKKAMTGTKVVVHASLEKLPASYGYIANSTKAVFIFDGKHWRFMTAYRDRLVQKSNSRFHCIAELSDSAKEAIVSRYHIG